MNGDYPPRDNDAHNKIERLQQRLSDLESKLDSVERDLESRCDSVQRDLDSKIDSLEHKVNYG